jgi:hypothetical protein
MRVACVHVNIIPLAVMMFSVRINRIIGINSLVPTGEPAQRERRVCNVFILAAVDEGPLNTAIPNQLSTWGA